MNTDFENDQYGLLKGYFFLNSNALTSIKV